MFLVLAPWLHIFGSEMRRLLTLLTALTLAGAAQAAPQTSGLSVQREEVVGLDSRRMSFAGQRIRLEAELDGLSSEIARLKSKSGSLIGGGSLDGKLVRSRELSAQIDSLRAQEGTIAHKLERKAEALLSAYDAQLEKARTTLETAEGEARTNAISELTRLENDRRSVRAGLDRLSPDAVGHKLERKVRAAETQDPDSLRAEADRLRDTRDRLLRRIKALQRRSNELRAQAELEAEMRSFQAETSLFDETDFSTTRVTATANRNKSGGIELTSSADTSTDGDQLFGMASGGGSNDGDPGAVPGGDFNSPPAAEGRSSSEATSATAAGYDDNEAFFQLDHTTSRTETLDAANTLLHDDDRDGSTDDVLESRKAAMKRLADRLEARARTLDSQASSLDR